MFLSHLATACLSTDRSSWSHFNNHLISSNHLDHTGHLCCVCQLGLNVALANHISCFLRVLIQSHQFFKGQLPPLVRLSMVPGRPNYKQQAGSCNHPCVGLRHLAQHANHQNAVEPQSQLSKVDLADPELPLPGPAFGFLHESPGSHRSTDPVSDPAWQKN